MLSGPIVDDQLAMRVAGDLRLGRMASDIADGIAGADIDRDDYGQLRVKLLAEPRALPGLRVEASYVHSKSQAPQFEGVRAPFRARRVPEPDQTNGIWRTNVDSLTTAIDYQIGPALKSTTTLSYGAVLGPALRPARAWPNPRRCQGLSGESILRWRPPEPVKLLGGAHILTTRQRQSIDITGLGIGTGGFRDRQAQPRPVRRGDLAAGAGARDHRRAALPARPPGSRRPGRPGRAGVSLDYDETFDAWLPKLSVAYDLTEQGDGRLAGPARLQSGRDLDQPVCGASRTGSRPETLWNYEAFLRGSFDRGGGRFAANLFHNDIKQAQRPQTVEVRLPNGSSIFPTEFANAPAAESYGAEVELGWRASRRLSLARRTRAARRPGSSETLLPRDPSLGKEFQRSPQLSAAAAIDWRPLDALRAVGPAAPPQRLFQRRRQYAVAADRADDGGQRARRLSAGPVTLFGYARNLFDDFYLTYLFNPTFGTAGDPREIGIGLEARF